MGLRGPATRPEHECALPSLDGLFLADRYVLRWRWLCPECSRVYRPVEGGECLFCPLWEWSRMWPLGEWWWRRKLAASNAL